MNSVFFAGGPHTGKSTYLALLVLAITQQRRVSLALGSFKDDREYVMELARSLVLCEPQPRTNVDERRGLSLSIALPDRESEILEVPDLSGEIWKELLTERTWTLELEQRVGQSQGLCIFVNAARFAEDPTLTDVDRARAALGINNDETLGANVKFAVDEPMGQLALVDLIQILARQPGGPRRIALIVSAFDSSGETQPGEWLTACAPLARQYLGANADSLPIRIYGLSAQGGDFEKKDERTKLRTLNAVERASVLREDGSATDLDEPVRWAMGID